MIVIPAVDIKGGRCVRLEQGIPERETVYGADPVEQALRWTAQGAQRIHVVDLDGAFGLVTPEDLPANIAITRAILAAVRVPVQVGGGVRSAPVAEALLEAGADRVVVGTRAIEDRAFLEALARAHPGRINLGLDARDGRVAVRGWSETSVVRATELLRELGALPLGEVIYTDIARDGMLEGPNLEAIAQVIAASPHPVIASGGVTRAADLTQLAALGACGAIIGKALYAGTLTLQQAHEAAARGTADAAALGDDQDS